MQFSVYQVKLGKWIKSENLEQLLYYRILPFEGGKNKTIGLYLNKGFQSPITLSLQTWTDIWDLSDLRLLDS